MKTETYDYVIVGAGSAGCVLANRLSEDPSRTVLLLEAGGSDVNPLIHVPLLTGKLFRSRMNNWFYSTEPDPGMDDRKIFQPRGKVLGGTSSINGMVYIRGHRTDYDRWAAQGLPGWSYREVLPYFKRSEHHENGPSAYHGGDGPLNVGRGRSQNPLFEVWEEAGVQAGFPRNTDFNGQSQSGFGRYDFTIRKGRRWSTSSAFLRPALGRSNLTVLTNAHASGIDLTGKRASGVRYRRKGRDNIVNIGRELILCAGAFNSPALLMQSGIGPSGHLSEVGVATVHDLPGVGANLQDHLVVNVQFACTQDITLHSLLRADRAAMAVARAIVSGTGPGSVFPLEGAAFFPVDPAHDVPDVQCHFLAGLGSGALRLFGSGTDPLSRHGFMANICQLRPSSRGEVRLRGASPALAPRIVLNGFSAPEDIAVLRKGVRRLLEVFRQKAFDAFRGVEIAPADAAGSDADLERWIRATAGSVFHPSGTCRMGHDDMAVVDGTLKVHGLEGLRVVDASIMPSLIGGNTNAPTIMIAEKAADMILGRPQPAAARL